MSNSPVNYEIYDEALNDLSSSLSQRVNSLENKLSSIKRELSILTQKFDQNRISKEDIENSQQTEELENKFIEEFQEILAAEKQENEEYINKQFIEKFNSDELKISTELIIKKDDINIFQSQIHEKLKEIKNKLQSIKTSKNEMINKLNDEESVEFFNILDELMKIKLASLESNNDKARALQDLLNMFVSKFKEEKKDFYQFEDNVNKSIDDLCEKILQIKEKE